jgi:hypothetical protein
MSLEELAKEVGTSTDRRHFLRRVGVATVGLTAAMFGWRVSTAKAYDYECCGLYAAPTNCTPVCAWCWNCCNTFNRRLNCCEGYASGPCALGNQDWICSYVVWEDWCVRRAR